MARDSQLSNIIKFRSVPNQLRVAPLLADPQVRSQDLVLLVQTQDLKRVNVHGHGDVVVGVPDWADIRDVVLEEEVQEVVAVGPVVGRVRVGREVKQTRAHGKDVKEAHNYGVKRSPHGSISAGRAVE